MFARRSPCGLEDVQVFGKVGIGRRGPGDPGAWLSAECCCLCSLNADEDAQHATAAIALDLQAAEWNSKY